MSDDLIERINGFIGTNPDVTKGNVLIDADLAQYAQEHSLNCHIVLLMQILREVKKNGNVPRGT